MAHHTAETTGRRRTRANATDAFAFRLPTCVHTIHVAVEGWNSVANEIRAFLTDSSALDLGSGTGSETRALAAVGGCSGRIRVPNTRRIALNLDGDSYRLQDYHARSENLRKATTTPRQPLQ